MKVALLTFHKALNNGALMQTYATCKLLQSIGHEVEIIDLRIEEKKSFFSYLFIAIRRLFVNQFISKYYPKFTCRYTSVEEIIKNPPCADCYVVGSDQVWNVDITKNNYLAFFLNFGDNNTKRYAFASSFGVSELNISNNQIGHIKENLKNFDGIAVREYSGKKILNQLIPSIKDVKVVLDPTLLMNNSYVEIIGKIKQKKQITVYKLFNDSKFNDLAKNISKELKMPLLSIGRISPIKGFNYQFPTGPKSWLTSIASSKLVLTDSFHGVAFCIIYKKNFIAFVGKNNLLTRITTLLKSLGLEDRLCYDYSNVNNLIKTPIDYVEVYKKLNIQRDNSINVLRDFLKK